MRIFKFRSYGKKGMLYFQIASGASIEEALVCFRNGDLMQYTGLKDRTGKEIYEGDIVTVDDYSIEEPPFHLLGRVVFSEGSFMVLNGEVGCQQLCSNSLTRQHQVEVIGNIYENPELLES